MRTPKSSWKDIDAVLCEHVHSRDRALRPPAGAAAVAKLEARLGMKLPRDFVASLAVHDGMKPNARGAGMIDYWRLMPIAEIQKAVAILLQTQEDVGGAPRGKPPKLVAYDAFWRSGWIPFMEFNGNHVVLDLEPGPRGKRGQIFRYHLHDGVKDQVVADSFAEWLDALAGELTARRFKLGEYGDILLDRKLT